MQLASPELDPNLRVLRLERSQPDPEHTRSQYRVVVDQLETVAPVVAVKLVDMETDLLAYLGFPQAHWPKIWSNNPIERLNRELKRRTDVVQIFPDPESVVRLIGALLVEVNDEMISADKRYIAAASLEPLNPNDHPNSLPAAPRTSNQQPRIATPPNGTQSKTNHRCLE